MLNVLPHAAKPCKTSILRHAASSTSMAQFHTFMAGLRGCGFSSAKGLVMFPAAQEPLYKEEKAPRSSTRKALPVRLQAGAAKN
jgi:hypothetical protein